MTKVFCSFPMNRAQPLAVGMTPRMVAVTRSFCIAGQEFGASLGKRKLLKPEKADPPFPGLGQNGRPVQEYDPVRLYGCRQNLRLAQDLERSNPETGHVKPVVLVRLDRLHEKGVVGLEQAGAAEHLVGPFEGLDGKHGALPHDAALADVEPRALAGNVNTMLERFPIDGGRAARQAPGRTPLTAAEG